jgi:hypothetical protein
MHGVQRKKKLKNMKHDDKKCMMFDEIKNHTHTHTHTKHEACNALRIINIVLEMLLLARQNNKP